MGKIMIIGCGGVGSVAVQKCCQNSDAFSEVVIASRTVAKCDALKAKLEGKTKTKIKTAQVDADDTAVLTELIRQEKPDVVLNLALPYQDLLNRKTRQSSNINGSGNTESVLKRQDLPPFWEADSIRA